MEKKLKISKISYLYIFFCIKNNKEETKMLKFSQNIPLIEFNESLVINIEADKFRNHSFNPLERINKKWFVNLSETSIPHTYNKFVITG